VRLVDPVKVGYSWLKPAHELVLGLFQGFSAVPMNGKPQSLLPTFHASRTFPLLVRHMLKHRKKKICEPINGSS